MYHYFINNQHIERECKKLKHITKFPHQSRTIVFGDIHGDYEALLVCLRDLAKVLRIRNKSYEWIGGDTFVVLLGDLIDRFRDTSKMNSSGQTPGEIKHEEEKIIDLLNFLSIESVKSGGRVIRLLGNHELMNIRGNTQYVTPYAKTVTHEYNGKQYSRDDYFLAGNPGALKLNMCGAIPMCKVGDYIYVHGGILPGIIKDFHKFNSNLDIFDYSASIIEKLIMKKKMSKEERNSLNLLDGVHISTDPMEGSSSILWERRLGMGDHPELCKAVRKTFEDLGYDSNKTKIVVGHCPQSATIEPIWTFDNVKIKEKDRIVFSGPRITLKDNKSSNFLPSINSKCINNSTSDSQVWRTDVAMSRAFDVPMFNYLEHYDYLLSRRPQVLEILYDGKQYTENIIMSPKDLPRKWLEKNKDNLNKVLEKYRI